MQIMMQLITQVHADNDAVGALAEGYYKGGTMKISYLLDLCGVAMTTNLNLSVICCEKLSSHSMKPSLLQLQ